MQTKYILRKDDEIYEFDSEKEACKFAGVHATNIAKDYRRGSKCNGYTIERVGLATHGESYTRLHKIWRSMRERCYRKKHTYYKDYGGRGITICKEWDSYEVFRNWAKSNGYRDELTIDRIDVNGNYEPDNCRWITKGEQTLNKRNSRLIEVNGEIMNASTCAKRYEIPLSTVILRHKHGRDILTGARKDGKYMRHLQ